MRRIEQFRGGFRKEPDGSVSRLEYSQVMETAEKFAKQLESARAAVKAFQQKSWPEHENMTMLELREAYEKENENAKNDALPLQEKVEWLDKAIRHVDAFYVLQEAMRPLEAEVIRLEGMVFLYEKLDSEDEIVLRTYDSDELPQA
jgi:hypothetical protein